VLLHGKNALVTGASRGIGEAIAKHFVEHGANVFLTARSESVNELARALSNSSQTAVALTGNICDESYQRALIQEFRRKLGSIDILVNNAGVLEPGILGMVQIDKLRVMAETNVLSIIGLTQYCVRFMNRERHPSIINLASIAGTQGIEGITGYSATKGAVIGFTKAAAKELAPKGIRVNAIAPGFIDTDMARAVGTDWFQKRAASIRLGRVGQPADIANCAVFLASELASYITGQVIGVDGGMQV
jgi:3-oxoacyl-[acyl-carrier protein] reductase